MSAVHRRMVDEIHRRHETAASIPGDFVRSAPTAIPSYPDTHVVMLTRDGVRPFRDEQKAYYLIYQSPTAPSEAWFDHVDEHGVVERREVSLNYGGQGVLDEIDQDILALLGEPIAPIIEANRAEGIEDMAEPITLTLYEEMRLHEERIQRWQPTAFSDTEASAA